MLPALRNLGHEVVFFESWDKNTYTGFGDLNRKLLSFAAQEKPDVVFVVLMNYEIWVETLDAMRERCGAAVINWAPDDSWKFRESSRFMLPHVDIHCTTYPAALAAANKAGFRNVRLSQWAASAESLAPPRPARECGIPVSFVGTAYGNRMRWIEGLKRRGIQVSCYGYGWPAGAVEDSRVKEIIRDSVISLNFADSGIVFEAGRIRRSRQIKARTFEVPGAGGFLMTEAADGLQDFYDLETEIVTFGDVDALANKIRYYFEHPTERDLIANAAFLKTKNFHTYESRFSVVLNEIERDCSQHPAQNAPLSCGDSSEWMLRLMREHADNAGLRFLRALLVGPMRLLFGPHRGPRAARKLFHEVCWRLCGEGTYRASGLPGRIFYRES